MKLISLVCGYIGMDRTVEYLVLIFFAGAVYGVLKYTLTRMEDGSEHRGLTKIKFTIPILTAYFILILSAGGDL